MWKNWKQKTPPLPFPFVGCLISRIRSTIQLHLHLPPHSNLLPVSICPLSSLSLSLSTPFFLHKCHLPYLKAFSADLRASLYRSHYKSLTPMTLLCWYSSTIFYFVCFVTECFGLGPRKGTLALSRGLTGMECELKPSGSSTAADLGKPASVSFCFFFQTSQIISYLILKWQMRKDSKHHQNGLKISH